MLHTWSRYAAQVLRWATGERAHRLTSLVAGFLPDALSDASRQVARWCLPLDGTPVDALPYILQAFGLPQYEEAYAATLARCRAYLATHAVAGAKEMLVSELVTAGLTRGAVDIVAVTEDGQVSFGVLYDAPLPVRTWDGSWNFGDGTLYGFQGRQVTATEAHNIVRLMQYFRPARERFLGVKEP